MIFACKLQLKKKHLQLHFNLFYFLNLRNLLPVYQHQVVAVRISSLMEQYAKMSKQYLKIITVWCTSLLVMNCVYIAFALFKFDDVINVNDLSEYKKSSCIAIGVLLHYFLLASFCFTFTITLIQYFIVYKSFKIFNYIFLKSLLFSFGIIF